MATCYLHVDGKLYLAVTNVLTAGTVTILVGNGNGTFQALSPSLVAGQFTDWVAVGDFNQDGAADLAVTNYGNSNVSVYLNQPAAPNEICFSLPLTSPVIADPTNVVSANFNGDGK